MTIKWRARLIKWLLKDYTLADVLNNCGITTDPSMVYKIAKIPADAKMIGMDFSAMDDTHTVSYENSQGKEICVSVVMPDCNIPFNLSDPLLNYLEVK